MLWWMWIVVWVAVVAVSVIFLAVVGFRVFRSGMRTLDEFGQAMDALHVNTPTEDTSARGTAGVPGIIVPALFSAPEDVRTAADAARTRRVDDRRSRRIASRADRGQPQLLRDMPHL